MPSLILSDQKKIDKKHKYLIARGRKANIHYVSRKKILFKDEKLVYIMCPEKNFLFEDNS